MENCNCGCNCSSGGNVEISEDLKQILEKYPSSNEQSSEYLIPLLQDVQTKYGYLNREKIFAISAHLGVPASKVYGVATFYNQFRLNPLGKNIIRVCRGTACHVK